MMSLDAILEQTIDRLFSKNIVLRYTDHLSNRELYKIIYRDILPCSEKKVDVPANRIEWRCVEDNETWLRYYASPVERRRFQEENDVDIPCSESPEFKRTLPG